MDPILDDDFDMPVTSQFNQGGDGNDQANLLRTPSPNVKKPKFDLSELDEKQKPEIPELPVKPAEQPAPETEKV